MRRHSLGLSAVAASLGLLGTAGATPALAAGPSHSTSHNTSHNTSASTLTSTTKPTSAATSLVAVLTGDQEVPGDDGAAVGAHGGKAIAQVKIKGNRVVFSLHWKGIDAPSAGHIHLGAKGQNGEVKVPLFTTAMPKTARAAAGHTAVEDAALAKALRAQPSSFYVNLHTKKFPGGAVRGQLHRAKKHVNPLNIIKGGKLRALASGFQEFSDDGRPFTGDLDGFGINFVEPRHGKVYYSLAWLDIGAPAAAHVHEGKIGVNGKVRFPLFTEPVPKNLFALSGIVSKLDPAGLKHITAQSQNFYFNLHNEEFPDGAIRGQLLR
ncbi:CHRD domain-containing protein [Streptomyces apocyni]|uniref:CHRD domain-containing protein n=1 Tax=Streptomyces apocyni TaxID=2654677 RepID=UPI0012EAB3A4|nr:CHRD domain-containing protein [Streptomyces apocyni]